MGCCATVFVLFFAWLVYYLRSLDTSVPPEFYFQTDDFISKYGYSYERHLVRTEDGLEITLFRIIQQKTTPGRHVPVLLEAGLFGSSDVMVMRGPHKDLPFILAEEGFDVWLGNYRGNRYCSPGPTANLSHPKTFNFGFEEIGVFDYAASIDYMVEHTRKEVVDVVVVSAGSSSLLALQSLRPQYNLKIGKALHLGSGMQLRLDNPYQVAWFYLCWKLPWLVEFSRILEPLPSTKPQTMLVVCERSFLAPLCRSLLTQSIGYPEDHHVPTLSALLFSLLPSGNPLGVVDHVMQLTMSGMDFVMRDWGPEENLRRYNQSTPPVYDVSGISTYTKSYVTKDEGLVIYDMPRKVFSRMGQFAGEFVIESPFAHVNFFINSARSRLFIHDVIHTLTRSNTTQ